MSTQTVDSEPKNMKKLDFSKQMLPHIVAVLVFLLITFIFFKPYFLEDKILYQYDVLQGKGGAQELKAFHAETGEEGLWTTSMFGGMPAYLVYLKFSGDLLKPIYEVISLGLPGASDLIFLTFLGYYIMLLAFGVRPYLAMAGALAFGLSTFNIISLEAGHNSKIRAIAMMPLVMAGIHLVFRHRRILGFLLAAFGLYAELMSNHLQITYYLLLVVVIYGLVQLYTAYKYKELPVWAKNIAILTVAAVIAVGANSGRLMTVIEYGEYSIRGKSELSAQKEESSGGLDRDYAFRWSNGVMESLTLIVPNFYGGASQQSLDSDSNLAQALRKRGAQRAQVRQYTEKAPTYWGDQPFTAGPIYAGAIVCFLFVLGIFFAPTKYKAWLISVTVLSLLLSWGKNFESFNYFLFDYLPGYNKFRAVSMALTMAIMAMPLLGMIGLEKLLENGWTPVVKRKFYYSAGISAGLCFLLIMVAGMFSFTGAADAQMPAWFSQAMQADREDMLRSDAWRSIVFILAAGALIYFALRNKLSTAVAVLGLGFLIALDLGMVDGRYLKAENFKRNPERQFFAATEADKLIKQDPDEHYRVLNLQNPFNDARTSYHHSSIGGYHGAKMRRYQDLIERAITPEMERLISDLKSGGLNDGSYDVLDMLNTKYFVAGPGRNAVIPNKGANGNVWFVSQLQTVNSPDEEIAAVSDLNTKTTAVVDASKFSVDQKQFSQQASATLTDYSPNELTYKINASQDAFAVFSEVYYPEGWTATIDGQEAEILRANYVLRALNIPAGEHTVKFRFEPASYYVGNKIMLGSSILFYILAAAGIFVLYRRQQKKEQQQMSS